MTDRLRAERWNHNLHYPSVILNTVVDGSARALNVGCGEGTLARQLRRRVPQVTAIDLDQTSIDLAQYHGDSADIEYVLGDFLAFPFEPASFDVIASVAALHHMDAAAALGRMRDLLRCVGTLAKPLSPPGGDNGRSWVPELNSRAVRAASGDSAVEFGNPGAEGRGCRAAHSFGW